jgi:hypothetical protein
MYARRRILGLATVATLGLSGCATLGELMQAPRFSVVEGRDAELRLLGPGTGRPMGGAAIRIWTRVQNPNAFGVTLSRLAGELALEGTRAAGVDFPLGLPLSAAADTIVPLDVTLSFSDLPQLADVLTRAVGRNHVAYRLDGTLAVDAGLLGQPTFGPTTWVAGQMAIFR